MADLYTGGISLECVCMTPEGLAPVDWLDTGDLIETKDHGFQPVVRVARRMSDLMTVDGVGAIAPDQRVLASGWAVEMYFGVDEMLAHARDVTARLAGSGEMACIVMAQPMVLRVGSAWAESHGWGQPCHPTLSRGEVTLVSRAFGCPVERCDGLVEPDRDSADVSTTFGSRSAVA